MKKTKIVCTLGPSSSKVSTIKKMIAMGMNVARFNMSHGNEISHKQLIDAVKQAREELNQPVGIMLDTKGPEIRIGVFENSSVNLKDKDKFILKTHECIGNSTGVYVNYARLPEIVKKDSRILLSDGLIELKVISTTNADVLCEVVHGGVLSNNKSINLPDIDLRMEYLSDKDKKDIKFGIKQDVDILALSFVNCAQDVLDVKNYIASFSKKMPLIISKIESKLGVKNMDEIIKESDGIMVARGDLGVEINFESLPLIQKTLIEKCNKLGKISITATQMLESMIENPRPTRAEVSDISNAVLDGSSAIMLSGETSVGKFPVETVSVMSKVAQETENHLQENSYEIKTSCSSEGIGLASYSLACSLNAKCITVVTTTGNSALQVSRFKPQAPILALSPNKKTVNKLSIVWGTYPVLDKKYGTINELLLSSKKKAVKLGYANVGDLIVSIAGAPSTIDGTNLLTVTKI